MVVSANGAELTSSAILRWSQERQIEWHYVAPGKPMLTGFVERLGFARIRLNRSLQDDASMRRYLFRRPTPATRPTPGGTIYNPVKPLA